MPIDIKVPVLPESVTDATMMVWHKKAGEAVARDESLVDLETDKVVLEVPAPESGVLAEIVKDTGETVQSGDVIARFEPGAVAAAEPSVAPEPAAPEPQSSIAQPALGPAARNLIAEHGLEPSAISGTGKDGRILKEDVVAQIDKPGEAPAPVQPSPTATSLPVERPAGERGERREPMSRLRRTIATRLLEAQQTAALLTTFNEVDLGAVMDLRRRHRDDFEKKHGVRLGFMSFFVKASVAALRRFPAVNAGIDGADFVYHDYYDIGIAVSSPRGLVVPIVRDADTKGFPRIEAEIAAFGEKARTGALSLDELTGGTFTITNGGVFGSLLSTPIINPPQSAILGMHKIQERPMAIDGQVVVRPMMYLALTYDHRIIDGREAVQTLVTIKEALEDPARLLLDL